MLMQKLLLSKKILVSNKFLIYDMKRPSTSRGSFLFNTLKLSLDTPHAFCSQTISPCRYTSCECPNVILLFFSKIVSTFVSRRQVRRKSRKVCCRPLLGRKYEELAALSLDLSFHMFKAIFIYLSPPNYFYIVFFVVHISQIFRIFLLISISKRFITTTAIESRPFSFYTNAIQKMIDIGLLIPNIITTFVGRREATTYDRLFSGQIGRLVECCRFIK